MILFLLLLMIGGNLYAEELNYKKFFNPSDKTPETIFSETLLKPDTTNNSNNLAVITGSFKKAVGEALYFRGKVLTSFGIPISNVVVEIWQANAAGRYHSILKENSKYFDKNFSMSGRYMTNNLGQFEFITIFPGFYGNRAPHINVKLSHHHFGEIVTEVYFKNHPRNEKDPYYNLYTDDQKKLITCDVFQNNPGMLIAGKTCVINFVMDGIYQYKNE